MLTDESRYHVLRLLAEQPGISQRDVAKALGFSLGKVNYCVQALAKRGLVKATNFKNCRKKAAYLYLLTPRGLEEKARVTVRFLQQKVREHESLRVEIARIRQEVSRDASGEQSLGVPAQID